MRNRATATAALTVLGGFTAGIWWQLQTIRQRQTQVFVDSHLRLMESDPFETVVNGVAALGSSLHSDYGLRFVLSESLPRAMARNVALDHPIPAGQGAVYSFAELRNGELISGGPDGTLLFLSAKNVAKIAFEHELTQLMRSLQTMAENEAISFCRRMGSTGR